MNLAKGPSSSSSGYSRKPPLNRWEGIQGVTLGGVACFANALIEVVDLLVRVALVDGRKLTNETRPAHSAR
jgi:hypothetical protein